MRRRYFTYDVRNYDSISNMFGRLCIVGEFLFCNDFYSSICSCVQYKMSRNTLDLNHLRENLRAILCAV